MTPQSLSLIIQIAKTKTNSEARREARSILKATSATIIGIVFLALAVTVFAGIASGLIP